MAEVFQHLSAKSSKMEPVLRSAQVLKQEAEEIGLEGNNIPDYVKRHQALDREDRATWRNLQLAKIQADAEKEKRSEEIQMAQKIKAAREQAKIEADKELALKELELKAQQDRARTSLAATPPLIIKMPSPQSYHPL